MSTLTAPTGILEKTRELCESILADPAMEAIRSRIDTFMADAKAKGQYEAVMSKGQALQDKQQQQQPLSAAEIADFEKHRDELLGNPVARGFLDAQEELHELKTSVQKMVSKTLELGRVPGEADLEEGGSCGSGCGCHH